jgi:hypothetical protein
VMRRLTIILTVDRKSSQAYAMQLFDGLTKALAKDGFIKQQVGLLDISDH